MYPQGPVTCFKDRHTDQRCVSLLPRNFQVIDASRIDIASLLQGFSGISIGHALFVDERELQLLDAELGKGATGQVVEGNFRGKPVAVKVVDLSDAPRDVCQSLQREASVVLAVSGECRHTCQYKGAIIKGNKFCLIMTRYSKSVARIVAETKAGLELSRLIRYGSQVLSALHELHSQGVVMADVKPQNLLLEESLDELVVTDFGLSRIVSHTIGGYRPSHQGGTPNYMSPELFSIDDMGNPTPCTPAVDIWAWACTMIHMVTGKVPFSNLNDTQICMQVGVHKRAPPIPTTLPDALQLLLRQCLAVSAEQRPTAAQALQAMMSSNITEAAAGGPQVNRNCFNIQQVMTCLYLGPIILLYLPTGFIAYSWLEVLPDSVHDPFATHGTLWPTRELPCDCQHHIIKLLLCVTYRLLTTLCSTLRTSPFADVKVVFVSSKPTLQI
eukprot:GHUV01055246.1.p1 GENE.GHUV01055246.1~~GHUV01055246.1.p1  ORF type:complete len:442 (+),score=53.08 GHUV01055246.1:977-2302(+)